MTEALSLSGGGLVRCPACAGRGYQIVETTFGTFSLSRNKVLLKEVSRQRPCLSCRKTGQVEAERVCPTCGKFLDMCACVIGWRSVGIKYFVEESVSEPKYPGVYRAGKQWKAMITKEGKQYYLGVFDDQGLAVAIVEEARGARASEIDDLRQRYAALQDRQRADRDGSYTTEDLQQAEEEPPASAALPRVPGSNGHRPALIETLASDDPAGAELLALVRAARTADAYARRLDERAMQAHDEARQATQEAVDAWNRVAEALCSVADSSPSFLQSLFGRTVEDESQAGGRS